MTFGFRRCCYALCWVGVTLVFDLPLGAQARTPRVAERVRVTVLPDSTGTVVQVIGTVRAMRGDSLFLRPQEGSVLPLPFARIAGIEGSVQFRSRTTIASRYLNNGLVVGGLVGAVAGTIIASSALSGSGGQLEDFLLPFLGFLVGGAVGMPAGAAVGYGMSNDVETDTWVRLAVPPTGSVLDEHTAPPPLVADERRAILAMLMPIGMRVAVYRLSDEPDVMGNVQHADSTLTVQGADGQLVTVPWSDVRLLQRSLGRPSASRLATAGIVFGALGGAYIMTQFPIVGCEFDNCTRANAVMIGGSILGAAAGGAIALGRRTERWQTIPLPAGLRVNPPMPTALPPLQ